MAGTLEQPLTTLHEREHTFRLRLPGWAEARGERPEGDRRIPVKVQGGSLIVKPGTYRLIRWRTTGLSQAHLPTLAPPSMGG